MIVLPAQTVNIDTPHGVDTIWYEKLKQMASGALIGRGAIKTTATTGFGYLPTCAGAPTGVPIAQLGYVPAVYDTTNNKLWIYTGVWKGVALV
jgi:hypothetical protein